MPASDFQIMPTWVQLEEPNFFSTQKVSESLRKDRQNATDYPIYMAKLIFQGLTDAQRKTIYDHFIARKGSYESFAWKSAYIPSYVKDMFNAAIDIEFDVRWIPGSFQSVPLAHGWDVEISALIENPGVEFSGTRITEEGDTRITEEGDTRILEGREP